MNNGYRIKKKGGGELFNMTAFPVKDAFHSKYGSFIDY